MVKKPSTRVQTILNPNLLKTFILNFFHVIISHIVYDISLYRFKANKYRVRERLEKVKLSNESQLFTSIQVDIF